MNRLSKNSNDYRKFICNLGYAEQGSIASIVFSRSEYTPMPDEAMWQDAWEIAFLDLREALLCVILKDYIFNPGEGYSITIKDCCKKYKKKEYVYCPICRTEFKKNSGVLHNETIKSFIIDFFYRLFTSDIDQSNCVDGLWETLQDFGWSITSCNDSLYTTEIRNIEYMLSSYNEIKNSTSWMWDDKINFFREVEIYKTRKINLFEQIEVK